MIAAVAGLVPGCAFAHEAIRPQPKSYLSEAQNCRYRLHGQNFSRTDLLFGLARPGGPEITEQEFHRFINNEIAPRFPKGFTVLNGEGRFRGSSGIIVREPSKILILLYRFSQKSNRAIEAIRTNYKNSFRQESVLRIDEASCVSF